MLATALNQHPQLKVAGEVLVRPERYGVFDDLDAEGQPCNTMEDAWSKYNGFINQRDHTNPWVWNYVSGLADVIFLSLKRRNILATLVSQKIAEATKTWQLQGSPSTLMDAASDDWVTAEYTPKLQVDVDYEETDQLIEKVRSLYWNIDQKIMHFRHPFLELHYEDLLIDWTHWMNIVQLCLCVEPVALAPATRQQETRPLKESIRNFTELRARVFSEDKWWGHMLEE